MSKLKVKKSLKRSAPAEEGGDSVPLKKRKTSAKTKTDDSEPVPGPAESTTPTQILSFPTPREGRKWAKQRTLFLNKKMAEYAARKQETKVLQFLNCFLSGENELKHGCKPTEHTWTNLINLYVKLGNMKKASEIWEREFFVTVINGENASKRELKTSKSALAAATAMLKGFWVEFPGRDEPKALRLLDELTEAKLLNSRSLSTFFRGCLRWGRLDEALKRYESWKKNGNLVGGGNLDYSGLEYLVSLCLAGLRVKTAREIYEEFEKTVLYNAEEDSSKLTLRKANTGVYMRLKIFFARAKLLLGQRGGAKEVLDKIRNIDVEKEWVYRDLWGYSDASKANTGSESTNSGVIRIPEGKEDPEEKEDSTTEPKSKKKGFFKKVKGSSFDQFIAHQKAEIKKRNSRIGPRNAIRHRR